jgi:hypothetical protein
VWLDFGFEADASASDFRHPLSQFGTRAFRYRTPSPKFGYTEQVPDGIGIFGIPVRE